MRPPTTTAIRSVAVGFPPSLGWVRQMLNTRFAWSSVQPGIQPSSRVTAKSASAPSSVQPSGIVGVVATGALAGTSSVGAGVGAGVGAEGGVAGAVAGGGAERVHAVERTANENRAEVRCFMMAGGPGQKSFHARMRGWTGISVVAAWRIFHGTAVDVYTPARS
jgi:hypothetical protein